MTNQPTPSEAIRAFSKAINEAAPAICARMAEVGRELNASIEKMREADERRREAARRRS